MDQSDWRLNPLIFRKIDQLFGPLEVDLFASRLINQLQKYFSWRLDSYAATTDALLQDWRTVKGFANPPWCRSNIVSCLRPTSSNHLGNPSWKSQPWYPVLLDIAIDCPRLIVDYPVIVDQHHAEIVPQLAVWHISGRDTPV